MFPFTFVKEIAAFRGDKIFWKRRLDLWLSKSVLAPKCGNTTFIATAHVTQTWLVDEDGDFIEAKSDCDEVTHAPDAEDLFIMLQVRRRSSRNQRIKAFSRKTFKNHSLVSS